MKINLCENYIRYRITNPKGYVTYMCKDMHFLRTADYEPLVTKRYIRVGEVEKDVFSVTSLLNGPFKGVIERRYWL